MKQRVAEMEKEADKLRQLQAAAETATEGGDAIVTDEDKAVADSRSVFVGNVSVCFLGLHVYICGLGCSGLTLFCCCCVWTG
jgi:hypothetical protein